MTRPAAKTPTSDDDRGLRCPDCYCRHLYVLQTRAAARGRVRRRRECRHCGRRITTYEAAAEG